MVVNAATLDKTHAVHYPGKVTERTAVFAAMKDAGALLVDKDHLWAKLLPMYVPRAGPVGPASGAGEIAICQTGSSLTKPECSFSSGELEPADHDLPIRRLKSQTFSMNDRTPQL